MFLCLSAVIFAGCAAGPRYMASDFQAPLRVAVLPFTNITNDVTAPETLRKSLIQMLPSRGYHPMDAVTVDEVLLKKFGITEGGQLGVATPAQLGAALNVDALFYGEVLSFIDLPLGYVRKRTVKANLKLMDVKTEKLMWEDQRGWTTPELHIDKEAAKAAAIRQVAERQLEKMTGTFLLRESQIVLDRMLMNLPMGR